MRDNSTTKSVLQDRIQYDPRDISYFSNATLQNSECPCHTRHSPPSVSHGCASLFPEPFPAICCQTRTCTCRQAGLASAVRLHSPLPLSHPCSFLHPFVKERCWMYRLLNFRSARSVQRNFFHVICTRGPLTPMPSIQGQKYFIPMSGCRGSSKEEYDAVYHSIRFE